MKWPDVSGDRDWERKLEKAYLREKARLREAHAPLRGANAQAFAEAVNALRADYHDQLQRRENDETAARSTATRKAPVQDTVIEWAEDLGRLLGTAQTRAQGWLTQRKALADQLAQIRDTASSLLSELTGSSNTVITLTRAGRRSRPTPSKNARQTKPAKNNGVRAARGRATVSAAPKAGRTKLRAGKAKSAKKREPA